MNNTEPQIIRTTAAKIELHDIVNVSWTFESIIQFFVNLKLQIETQGFSNLTFESPCWYDDQYIKVMGDRPETKKEVAVRIKMEERKQIHNEKIKASKDAKDLKEYKRLKKKFGDT